MPVDALVSVIIPSYNYAHLITRAIDSVIAQQYQNWELIVTDDCSTDDSQSVLAAFQDHPNVQIHFNEKNLGLYENVLHGISFAKGTYIKVLMADDWLAENYLTETVTALEKYPEAALCSVRAQLVDSSGDMMDLRKEPILGKEYYPRSLMLSWTMRHINPIGNPSRVIFRRSAYEAVNGFDLSIQYCTEYDLWLRMLDKWDCVVLPQVLSYETWHHANATKSYVANAQHISTAEQMFEKLFRNMSFYKGHYWRQQRVWLFGLRQYWYSAIRHRIDGNVVEFNELIQMLKRRSNILLWGPLLAWRSTKIILNKLVLKLTTKTRETS